MAFCSVFWGHLNVSLVSIDCTTLSLLCLSQFKNWCSHSIYLLWSDQLHVFMCHFPLCFRLFFLFILLCFFFVLLLFSSSQHFTLSHIPNFESRHSRLPNAKDAFDIFMYNTWPYSIEKKLTLEMWRDMRYAVRCVWWDDERCTHMDLKCAVCILSLNFRCGFCYFGRIQRFSTFGIYECMYFLGWCIWFLVLHLFSLPLCSLLSASSGIWMST